MTGVIGPESGFAILIALFVAILDHKHGPHILDLVGTELHKVATAQNRQRNEKQ
jgi:hypothetical protein